MRSLVYEIMGLGLMLASAWFFYRCLYFLAEKDYLAGIVVLVIGFVVIRTGVELGKLAVLNRRKS